MKSRRCIVSLEGSGTRQRSSAIRLITAGKYDQRNRAQWSILRSSKSEPPMSLEGQKFALPHRNIGIRFTPVSRHYASDRPILRGWLSVLQQAIHSAYSLQILSCGLFNLWLDYLESVAL